MNRQVREIMAGPPSENGEAKSVRLKQAVTVLAVLARRQLDRVAAEDCSADEFLTVAEREFSDELKDGVGGAMFDGAPVVPYDEWLDDVRASLAIVESE